jgi:hypothetical protein
MDGGALTLLAAVFALGAGAAGVLWRRVSTFTDAATAHIDKRMDDAVVGEIAPIGDRLDSFSKRTTAIEQKLAALQQRDHDIEVNILKAVKEAADDSVKWREELRKEFAHKDAVDGRIAVAIAERFKECQALFGGAAKEHITQRMRRADVTGDQPDARF